MTDEEYTALLAEAGIQRPRRIFWESAAEFRAAEEDWRRETQDLSRLWDGVALWVALTCFDDVVDSEFTTNLQKPATAFEFIAKHRPL